MSSPALSSGWSRLVSIRETMKVGCTRVCPVPRSSPTAPLGRARPTPAAMSKGRSRRRTYLARRRTSPIPAAPSETALSTVILFGSEFDPRANSGSRGSGTWISAPIRRVLRTSGTARFRSRSGVRPYVIWGVTMCAWTSISATTRTGRKLVSRPSRRRTPRVPGAR